ncbi:bifunctional Cyclic nucleotide-binding-like/RmlC-like jelly roll fold/Cyclic nucleotide-binding domain/EF-hand domain/EF-Hand 1 [Babesia duncani]|uniref:Bifunctional Cyclic nucleotide-binding-like/RmlC-like jelly roll fold/Cyclic nucleotide-binding domain/EF-hand domain/EF-Hand 1 n=1 Tax=Babesia duncani TaxID=323732 RepID=A0AAD9PJA2_9APIC|nr:bifunctional Cyclic nucleotide-binding-like/RmlC-like jelly roll fold/Cyclic nucleotide-binding domain/EF-hand domain/EF-Hand 1 [Babesia duncani]
MSCSWKHKITEMAATMDSHLTELISLTKNLSCVQDTDYIHYKHNQDKRIAKEALHLLKLAKLRIDGDRTRLKMYMEKNAQLERLLEKVKSKNNMVTNVSPITNVESQCNTLVSPIPLSHTRGYDDTEKTRQILKECANAIQQEPWVYLDNNDPEAMDHYKKPLEIGNIKLQSTTRKRLIQLYSEMLQIINAERALQKKSISQSVETQTVVTKIDSTQIIKDTKLEDYKIINKDTSKSLEPIPCKLDSKVILSLHSTIKSSISSLGQDSIMLSDLSRMDQISRESSNASQVIQSAPISNGISVESIFSQEKAQSSRASIVSDLSPRVYSKESPIPESLTRQETINQDVVPETDKLDSKSINVGQFSLDSAEALELDQCKSFNRKPCIDGLKESNAQTVGDSISSESNRHVNEQKIVLDMELMLLLERVPVLNSLPPERLKSLSRYFSYRTYLPNSAIIIAGEEPMYFYILASGTVSVFLFDGVGNPNKLVRQYKNADYFGEMSLINNSTCSAYIIADCHVAVQAMEAKDFRALLQDLFPAFISHGKMEYKQPKKTSERQYILASTVLDGILKFLKSLPVISALENLEDIANELVYEKYNDKQVAQRVDKRHGFFIIYKGKMSVQAKRGDLVIDVATLGPTMFIGGFDFKDENIKEALGNTSLVAEGETILLSLDPAKVQEMIADAQDDLIEYMEQYYRGQMQKVKLNGMPLGQFSSRESAHSASIDGASSSRESARLASIDGASEGVGFNGPSSIESIDEEPPLDDGNSEQSSGPTSTASSETSQLSCAASHGEMQDSTSSSTISSSSPRELTLQHTSSIHESIGDSSSDTCLEESEGFGENVQEDLFDSDLSDSLDSIEEESILASARSTLSEMCKDLFFATLKNKYTSLGAAFVALDTNGSGTIDLEEFVNFIQGLGIGAIDIGELPLLFDILKDPSSGSITIQSFFIASEELIKTPGEFYLRLVDIYRSCRVPFENHFGPLGKNTTCSRSDFLIIASKIGIEEPEALEIFKACDVCSNEYVTVMTLLKLMRGDWGIDEAIEYETRTASTLSQFMGYLNPDDDLALFKREFSSKNMAIGDFFDPGDDVSLINAEYEEFDQVVKNLEHVEEIACALGSCPEFKILSQPQRLYMASFFTIDTYRNHKLVEQGQDMYPLVIVLDKSVESSYSNIVYTSEPISTFAISVCNAQDFCNEQASGVTLQVNETATVGLLSRQVYSEFIAPMFKARIKKVELLVKFLSNFKALQELKSEQIATISNACVIREYKMHETIYKRGDTGTYCYIIFNGSLVLVKPNSTRVIQRFGVLPSLVLETRLESTAVANSSMLILLTWHAKDFGIFKDCLDLLRQACNAPSTATAQACRRVSFAIKD